MTTEQTERALATTQPEGQKVVRLEDLALPQDAVSLARVFHQSGFFKDTKSATQAVVKVMAGRELGFGAFASMNGIHIIEAGGGVKLQLSANMVGALIKRSGRYDFEVVTLTAEKCVLRFTRDGKPIGEVLWDIDMAKRAGLVTERGNWTKYPESMLFARALTNGAKRFCPEVMLTTEIEIASEAVPEEPTAIDETDIFDGEVVDVPLVRGDEDLDVRPNWDRFWAVAGEMRFKRSEIHAAFGCEDVTGALADAAATRAETAGKPLAQVLAEMVDELPERIHDYRAAKSAEFVAKANQHGAGRPLEVSPSVRNASGAMKGSEQTAAAVQREIEADRATDDALPPEDDRAAPDDAADAPDPRGDPNQQTPEELAAIVAEEKRLAAEATQSEMLAPDPKSKAHA